MYFSNLFSCCVFVSVHVQIYVTADFIYTLLHCFQFGSISIINYFSILVELRFVTPSQTWNKHEKSRIEITLKNRHKRTKSITSDEMVLKKYICRNKQSSRYRSLSFRNIFSLFCMLRIASCMLVFIFCQ